jgi:hypothetical protein
MSTCPPNLTHSFLTVCKIIMFKVDKKVFLSCAQREQQSFEGQKKNHFLKKIWNVPLHILVFKWVRYMSSKSHTHKRCGTLRKKSFSARGYAEIHIQRPFFDNKNSIWKILGFKIWTVKTCSSASCTRTNFYFWKVLKSWFLVEFQSFIFGQILAVLADFAALTVPQLGLKS